jgi:toxin ParE1/3/4
LEIHAWIAADSEQAADRFLARLSQALIKLARTGNRGVPREAISPGLRAIIHGHYVIYFRLTDDAVVIIRIVNSARDIAKLSFEENGE